MNFLRVLVGIGGTAVIAFWVAYAVSTPRNVQNAADDPMAALEGSTLGEEVADARREALALQCENARAQADQAWNRAVDNDRLDVQQDSLDEMRRQAANICAMAGN